MKFTFDIDYVSTLYDIYEDGTIYGKMRNRTLRHSVRNGYHYVYITPLRLSVTVHKLVALRYLGVPPSLDYEVNHIDGNRGNNRVENLEWITHSDNVKKSFEAGRRSYWKGRSRGTHSDETKEKMRLRKNKRVVVDDKEYESIESALPVIGVTRRTFNSRIGSGVIKGHKVKCLGVERLDSLVSSSRVVVSPVAQSYTLNEIEEKYDIFDDGKVCVKENGKLLLPVDTSLSVVYNLRVKWYFVQVSAARLVALKYLPPVAGKNEVGHKDGNMYNNHVDNLVWQSRSETRLKGNNPDYWWKNNKQNNE